MRSSLQIRRNFKSTTLDDRFHEGGHHGTDDLLADSSFAVSGTRSGIMARWRQAVEVAMTDEEIGSLTVLSRSRTEPASRVERAQMLLAYRENPSFFAVGQRLGRKAPCFNNGCRPTASGSPRQPCLILRSGTGRASFPMP